MLKSRQTSKLLWRIKRKTMSLIYKTINLDYVAIQGYTAFFDFQPMLFISSLAAEKLTGRGVFFEREMEKIAVV